MRGARAGTHRLIRPTGLSAGAISLALGWFGGFAVAQLTGATPILIVLSGLTVGAIWAVFAGLVRIARARVHDVELPALVTQGEPFPIRIDVRAPRWVWVDVRDRDQLVASGWSGRAPLAADGILARRGEPTTLRVDVRSAGGPGLVWWSRVGEIAVDVLVAARPNADRVESSPSRHDDDGELAGPAGAVRGDTDGIRPWREGDSEKYVHWASTLRAGELVVHDRRHEIDRVVTVRARHGTPDPDREAGAARERLDRAIHGGAIAMVAVDDEPPHPVADHDAAARWSATADLGPAPAARRPGWRGRVAAIRSGAEPDAAAPPRARWWAAGATGVALLMLAAGLGYGPLAKLLIVAVLAVGAHLTARSMATAEPLPALVRWLVGGGALLALGMVAAATGRVGTLLGVLRGPLPQLLVILVVLHGFECRDRRTIRVALAISAVVVMYAAGLRVDDALAWWLLAWAACFGLAVTALASGPARGPGGRAPAAVEPSALVRGAAAVGGRLAVGVVATVVALAVVPVPSGPARLTLPTIIEDRSTVTSPGAIVGPDGTVRSSGTDAGPDRAPPGQAGGYTGFAQSMDTSVRGDLGDEVVMRVRAPEPDFWRGQTFADFDGRRWYAAEELGTGRNGPNIDVPPALGDIRSGDVVVDDFVQTFFVEAEMPNVIFHAYAASQVVVDADVWTRNDGAIRASTTFGSGSIYTVVSRRAQVDAELLRAQGHIGPRLSDIGRELLAPYLTVPASTTPQTIELAAALADGRGSTYDVVRAYEAWLNGNVEYDLDAPLPAPGEDAVHDFLFDTRLGFCEQIASAMTVMLRTQGVPARLATGFLPGDRDPVAGVFEVRASDAHAWVEVWFPEVGWQAFDPTASVPLSANARLGTVGSGLTEGLADYAREHRTALLLAGLVTGVIWLVNRSARAIAHRRRRGRWGLLQDRFGAAAVRRGAPSGAPNPQLAAAWTAVDDRAVAAEVAGTLDRVLCDPTFDARADGEFARARELVGTLSRSRQ